MNVTLSHTNSPPNKLDKEISGSHSLTGSLRNQSAISNPTIIIEISNPTSYNYAHISEFNRYYFIDDIVSLRNDIWELHLRCDVLMSFKSAIKNSYEVIDKSTNGSPYIPTNGFVPTVKNKTDIINFPFGFGNSPYYILITAGGIAT